MAEDRDYILTILSMPTAMDEHRLKLISGVFGEVRRIVLGPSDERYIQFATIRMYVDNLIIALQSHGVNTEIQEVVPAIIPCDLRDMERCARCRQPAAQMCARCCESYCSDECFREHWTIHRVVCFPVPQIRNIRMHQFLYKEFREKEETRKAIADSAYAERNRDLVPTNHLDLEEIGIAAAACYSTEPIDLTNEDGAVGGYNAAAAAAANCNVHMEQETDLTYLYDQINRPYGDSDDDDMLFSDVDVRKAARAPAPAAAAPAIKPVGPAASAVPAAPAARFALPYGEGPSGFSAKVIVKQEPSTTEVQAGCRKKGGNGNGVRKRPEDSLAEPRSKGARKCMEEGKKLYWGVTPPDGSLVTITAVKSVNVVCVRLVDTKLPGDYKSVLSQVNQMCKLAPTLTHVPRRNVMAAAPFGGNTSFYYRVRVLSSQGSSRVKVKYVDFGNKDIVRWDELKVLPKQARGDETPIFECRLLYSLNERGQEALEYLREFERNEDETFTVKNNGLITELISTTTQTSINKEVSIILKETNVAKVPVMRPPFREEFLPIGVNSYVTVLDTSMMHKGMFGACRAQDTDIVEDLHSTVQMYAERDREIYKPRKNEYVLARFPTDTFWYRAKVLEIKEHRYHVGYIDVGNEATILAAHIRHYPIELTEPCRTSRCRLDGLPDVIPEEAIFKLDKMYAFGESRFMPEIVCHLDGVVVIRDKTAIDLVKRHVEAEKKKKEKERKAAAAASSSS